MARLRHDGRCRVHHASPSATSSPQQRWIPTPVSEAAEGEPELLAHHLAEAGQAERAIVYLQRAARWALARSADLEAAEHLRAALRQLDRVSGTERRDALEFELQAALGRALSTVRGFAAPETDRAFARAAELGQRLQVGARLFPVLWGRFVALHIAGQLERKSVV